MILFRARRWGSGEWTLVSIGGDEQEDEGPISNLVAGVLVSAGGGEAFHVQQMQEDGTWEDVSE